MQTNINISFGRKYLLVKRVDRFYGLSIRITGDCPEGGESLLLLLLYIPNAAYGITVRGIGIPKISSFFRITRALGIGFTPTFL